ncbi:hypothetical protein Tco_0498966 [Tanacetum coccineum]
MCKEGIVLGHKISKSGIEVDRAKVDVIAKLSHPTTVKGVRSFLGHAGFYRRFIQDFSKIARPMTHLLGKETPFVFSKDCIDAFETLKKKLTKAPILVDTGIQEKEQKENQRQANPSTEWKGQSQKSLSVSRGYNNPRTLTILKWVEAKVLPTNDARVVVKFLKSLFARFGNSLEAFIATWDPYFVMIQFAKVFSKLGSLIGIS